MRYAIICIAGIYCTIMSCADRNEQPAPAETRTHSNTVQPAPEIRYDCKTFDTDGGFGYDIYINGHVFVHQEHIPAVSGVHPFATESDAWLVGSMAVEKMKQGIVPPTISIQDMQSLGIVLPAQN